MLTSLFVTGTDTDVGKTVITGGLLRAFSQKGSRTAGYKPIAAGCDMTPNGLENADARFIQYCASVDLSLDEINPIRYAEPIAPHIAADKHGRVIQSQHILDGWHALAARQPDVLITEGAGGWELPISSQQTLPEVLMPLPLTVVLVVGMRLGCLNHALLTANAIQRSGFHLGGWVANQLTQPMTEYQSNIATLKAMLNAPLLGEVPMLSAVKNEFEHALGAEKYLNIEPLQEKRM